MSEWTDTYRTAIGDVRRLAHSRGIASPGLDLLLDDLESDALVIEREHHNRLRRLRLRAEREALPLLDKDNTP